MNTLKRWPMPRSLHEVFGESQSPWELLLILGSGLLCGLTLLLSAPGWAAETAVWRRVLAFVLMFDLGAGCVANFTRSTNDYYARRPAARWLFLALHIHLPLFAWAVGQSVPQALGVWAFTLLSAGLVNLLSGHALQRVLAGTLLALGNLLLITVVQPQPLVLAASLLFMLKLILSFAVDHAAGRQT